MIYRFEIEQQCLRFTERTNVSVSSTAVELISILVNTALEEGGIRSGMPMAERERRVRGFLNELPEILGYIAESQRVEGRITAGDILHGVVERWVPPLVRHPLLTFIFDKQ
jgi:hypothetical protein